MIRLIYTYIGLLLVRSYSNLLQNMLWELVAIKVDETEYGMKLVSKG